jgi:hypothetical protein
LIGLTGPPVPAHIATLLHTAKTLAANKIPTTHDVLRYSKVRLCTGQVY